MSSENNFIYIIGSGRSGSTLIERVLASGPNVVAVGELHCLWRLPMDEMLCSCGKRPLECLFWSAVMRESEVTPEVIFRLNELERQIVRNKYLLKKRYCRNSIANDPNVQEFYIIQQRIFEAIRNISGRQIVVDSSKAGPRAWILSFCFEPTYLHIHRSARDVIASWRKPKYDPASGDMMEKKGVVSAAVDWAKAEFSAKKLGGMQQLVRIDYDSFARAPRELSSISTDNFIAKLIKAAHWQSHNTFMPSQDNYHSLNGNPDRYIRGEVVISPKAVDRKEMSVIDRTATDAVGMVLDRILP